MSHLAHLVSSAFKVREVPPLCTSSECHKARSRATSAADVHLVAQPVGASTQASSVSVCTLATALGSMMSGQNFPAESFIHLKLTFLLTTAHLSAILSL
jgi:hypothetical protein